VIPPLLVPGIADEIARSKATKVYVCNVMTQPGESEGFSASQHVLSIVSNVEAKVFDYVVVNDGLPSAASVQRYKDSGQSLVEPDVDRIRAMGFRTLQGNIMSETEVVRHDPMKLAQRMIDLLERE